MTFEPTTAERPALSDFAWRTLGAADARDAAEVIRAAFSAQSRATRPPSSALRETADSIAAKIAAGGGAGAFHGGSLVAVVLWQLDGDALHVGRVSVLPPFRGRGLTRRLIAACEAAARERGAQRIRLRVRLALPENERLFERFGFVRRSLEAHEGFDAPTTAVMEKRLS
ncbi:MAG TPA: GNAT family N-acetyltransferase [Roseiarcus sp.]|nr:GNAT family N-acetyltransferase [Roseiarcus sp.]